jgi:phenylacetyl-CoA:acceptor oxidoreductase subunit 2
VQWGATSRLQRFWDIRAAFNFIGGGTGSSLLVWATLGYFAGLPFWPAALAGLLFIAGGLLMVWLEIGRPWRAFRVFFRPQTSWMTREGIVALPLFATGAAAVLIDAGVRLPFGSAPVAALITAFLSLVFLYCQLRILRSSRGLPAWCEPRAMPLLGLSGLAEGLGVYLLLTAFVATLPVFMLAAALVLIVGRAIAWHFYVSALHHAEVPESTVNVLLAMHKRFLAIGHGLPVALIGFAFVWPGLTAPFVALAGITASLGGWWLKSVLITRAAYIPKYSIPAVPVRGQPG